ncbi:hypothetical protein [Phenylobacterium sp.]|uniref:hypothetical protein n=1 Tax=Phenylobacterium sp. TaxID=1871053 RepID=UPI003983B8F2
MSLAALVVGASIFITELNNGAWSPVHLFTGWTLVILPVGVMWAKRHDAARHRHVHRLHPRPDQVEHGLRPPGCPGCQPWARRL